jgi:hypothetical protein
LWQILISIL